MNILDNNPPTYIRDALYDRIPMHVHELALIGLAPFQRLDRIQQLGFVSRIWPGAKHTRFEHSLGVAHQTRRALTHLRNRPSQIPYSEEDERTIVAAALLHDIGHYPFSHAIEELGNPVRSHEDVGRRLITQEPIASLLEANWQVDPDRVAGVVNGEPTTEADQLLSGLLSGTFDMDKLDYLPRDAHACNVPYGGVDSDRLIDSLTFAEVPDVLQPVRIAITDKGISPLHSLINARQEMFDNVYWHHTNRACMIMLLRAVQEALVSKAITADDLTNHDDASLLALMRSEHMPEGTKRLSDALAQRNIHKRGVEIGARAWHLYDRLSQLWYSPENRRKVEQRLAQHLTELTGNSVPDTAVLIDISKSERWKTDAWVVFHRPPVGFYPVMHWHDVVGMADDDFKRYEEHRRLIRIVAEAEHRDALAEHWETMLYPALGGIA